MPLGDSQILAIAWTRYGSVASPVRISQFISASCAAHPHEPRQSVPWSGNRGRYAPVPRGTVGMHSANPWTLGNILATLKRTVVTGFSGSDLRLRDRRARLRSAASFLLPRLLAVFDSDAIAC